MNTLSPQRLPSAERQATIVAAALALAREISPAQITTADIAARTGVSQGALFKHFPSKEAIWLACMDWVQQTLLDALQQAAQQASDPLSALDAMFQAHVGFVLAQPGVPRLIFHELQQPADSATKQAVRRLLQRYRQLLTGLFEAGQAQGLLPAELDREAAATAFVGGIQGLVMQSMLAGRSATAMRLQAQAIFAIYLRGLGAAR